MKCKITLGDVMEIKQDKRRFDFHDIGLAIKRARGASGMTQEQLAYHRIIFNYSYNDSHWGIVIGQG